MLILEPPQDRWIGCVEAYAAVIYDSLRSGAHFQSHLYAAIEDTESHIAAFNEIDDPVRRELPALHTEWVERFDAWIMDRSKECPFEPHHNCEDKSFIRALDDADFALVVTIEEIQAQLQLDEEEQYKRLTDDTPSLVRPTAFATLVVRGMEIRHQQ